MLIEIVICRSEEASNGAGGQLLGGGIGERGAVGAGGGSLEVVGGGVVVVGTCGGKCAYVMS